MLEGDTWTAVVPGGFEETIDFCVQHFACSCQQAVKERGAFYVALSGGSTPKAIFQKLTSPPIANLIPWNHVHLFWSDERSVPPTDPESNFRMAMDAGFSKMAIPANQIHRMKAESDIEAHAKEYELLLRDIRLDLVMLGMGEDGHTASLFPNTEALDMLDQAVVANYVPQKKTYRMTFTFKQIHAARQVVLYVLGASKKQKVSEILHSHAMYPVSLVGTRENKSLWILDQDAIG